jgi:ribulose-5-phosphate 4-epimerase/fuculose-1-phosphate aldolase
LLVCGESAAEAVVTHHFLEMACQGQIAALSAGEGNYTLPGKAARKYAHNQITRGGRRGDKDWAACLRLVERLDPSYKD